MSSKTLDRSLVLEAVRVTEAAAVAAFDLVGRGDEMAADQVAVDAMRTSLTAKSMPNALTVMAWAPAGTLLHAPDTYMDKIGCGPGYPDGMLDLSATPAQNVREMARAKGVEPTEITVCVLDRPRHGEIISSLREVGARIHLIPDGDIAGVIHTADPATGIDLYIGQGGAPEGVLACAALKCYGGQFQGRLAFRNADERMRAKRIGVEDLDKIYTLDEIVRADAIFAATGVTQGALLDGVRRQGDFLTTHSLVMNSSSRTVRDVRMRRPV
jgi:fructose-1,6-bisphosphatase II / sedoheptulose-1,7-bisphosphatase